MKTKTYTLREFLYLYDKQDTHNFIFSHKNNEHNFMRAPSVQYEVSFSSVKPVTELAQNSIKFFSDDGNFMIINNVTKIRVGESIPGFGTVITVVCGDGAIPATKYYHYEFIMR